MYPCQSQQNFLISNTKRIIILLYYYIAQIKLSQSKQRKKLNINEQKPDWSHISAIINIKRLELRSWNSKGEKL